jgi:O-antigen/teichoic acid export membrane protein
MAWAGAGRIVLMFVGIGSVAVLARLLTLEAYGVFAAAMIFVGIVKSGLVQAGFPAAVIQRQDLTPLHVRNAFTGMLLLHILAAILIWTGSGVIAAFFEMPELTTILRALCVTILVNPVLAMSIALLKRRKRFRLLAMTDVTASVFANTAVAIALAWAGFGVWALVISNITWALAQTLITFAFARFSLVPAITSHMRDLLRMSMGMTLFGALAVFTGHAAKFVIGRILGADALGVFSRSTRVLDFPKNLLGSSHVLFPVMADMNDDTARMARGYLRSIALCSLAAAPLTVLICHGAEGLILLLLGQRWTAAVEPTAILSLGLAFGLGNQVAIAVFMALGRVQDLVVRQFIYAVLIIGGSLIGSRWGLAGICVGILASGAVCYVLSIHLANRLLTVGWSAFAKANLPAVLLALPVLGVLVLGESLVWRDLQPIVQFPIEAAVAGAVVYVACILKPTWFLGPDGVWLLTELRLHLPARLCGLIPKKFA